jgi:hypothetical protein
MATDITNYQNEWLTRCKHIVNANWDSIVFDVANRPLQKVYMNEPLKGTRELTETIINSSTTVEEMLALLGQQDLPSSTL